MRIVLLSGPIAGGKSVLGDGLVERYGFLRVKTRDLIVLQRPKVRVERRSLQRAGDALDHETEGRWVADGLAREILRLGVGDGGSVVLDAVRREDQIAAVRAAFGRRVIHVHITAPESELAARYAIRHGAVAELKSYADVRRNKTERRVESLREIADVVVDTTRCDPEDVLTRVASALGLFGQSGQRLVDVLIGGQWGSEGKGHLASYLAPEYDVLVRTGGPNAGHTVYEGENSRYTFHLLPSGTRCSTARLLIGPGATIKIDKLLREIADCDVGVERLSIDPQVMVITAADVRKEPRLVAGMGSTGQGGGAAAARRIMGRGDRRPPRLARDYPELRPYIRDAAQVLETAFSNGEYVFLEGTQGTGLSLYHGSYPYVTSRDTTVSGACAEAGIAPNRVRRVILACRTYPIRVQDPPGGTSGPMGREISWDVVAARSGLPAAELKVAERTSTTNRERRVAEFGWAALRRAATLNGPSDVALTFADYLNARNRDARRFEQLDDATIQFVEEVERVAGAPVSLITTRFHDRSIIDRRSWRRR